MLFSSIVFIWMFLPIVFIGNFLLQKIGQKHGGTAASNIFLLIASIFFYAWGEPVYVFLMIASITINYVGGRLLDFADQRTLITVEKLTEPDIKKHSNSFKKTVLVLTITLNLLILFYFKYAGMFVETVNAVFGLHFDIPEISLPIGISFFTFQALSYVIDVYRGECEVQRNYLKMALYVSFFPQLIAGPIVKYRDIAAQIDHRTITLEQTASGIRRFVYGFGKKILISNTLALGADTLYALEPTEMNALLAWTASILYTFQIYYDFSGYSDMAIGLGRMFGFEFRENFLYPYTSTSIREFWQRWHVSLGSWFKDYVYIPLGGNRKGKIRTQINLWIVFFLTGLWHGASWSFVLWGLVHGFFSVLERISLPGRGDHTFGDFLGRHKIIGWIYTFLIVNFAWVLFRVENVGQALAVIHRMIMPWVYTETSFKTGTFFTTKLIAAMIFAVLACGPVQRFFMARREKSQNVGQSQVPSQDEKFEGVSRVVDMRRGQTSWSFPFSWIEILLGVAVFVFSIVSLTLNTYNPFIYFRF